MPLSNGLYYFLNPGGNASTPPLILLHGAGGSHLSWPAEMRRMSGYRVLTLDLPGHGRSEGIGKHTVEDNARSVIEFLNAVSIWKAVLIGHGLGGAVALSLALQAPERVSGLGLLSCSMRLPVPAAVLENASNPATCMQAVQTLLEGFFSPQVDPGIKARASRRLAETRPAVLYGDLLASSTVDLSQSLDKLRVPTLVVCGTEDRSVPINLCRSLSNAILGAAFQTIDRAGHAVMLEQPRRVSALFSVFLKTIPYVSGT